MELLELGLIPFTCLITALIIPITNLFTKSKRIISYIAISHSTILFALTIRVFITVIEHGVVYYRFGGFPPPIGVVYIVDKLNSILSLLVAFVFFICVMYSALVIDHDRIHVYYSLTSLLVMGVFGCLYTGDLFNLYVSIELVAVASYALTAFNSERGSAIRAAIIYGIFGTIITSIYLLSVLIIYGSYGTLNIVDVMLKATDPTVIIPYSGEVYGDITLATKISMALITWVFFFKSGIMPNHFWLPEVYKSVPLPIVALFTASADIIGIYGLTRLYYTIFTEESIIGDFRVLMISIIFYTSLVSSILASAIVMRQQTVRGLIAYSSIAQYSLALLGVSTGIPEGVAGAILHLIANALGDTLVLLSSPFMTYNLSSARVRILKPISQLSFTSGLLNLFGVIPVFPGFWSKAILTLSFIKTNMILGAVAVLVTSGLCAMGYFKLLITLSKRSESTSLRSTQIDESYIPLVVLIICLLALFSLGLSLTIVGELRDIFITFGACVFDRKSLLRILPK